jgi:hypothetical protein
MRKACHVDRRCHANGNGRECGKRLLPCQERVNPKIRALRGQLSHPSTHWHAETYHLFIYSPGEGLLFPSLHHHTSRPWESPDYPSLRASDEHILIVRPSDIQMILPSLLLPPQGGGLFGSQLRTSNDHSFIVGVP